MEEYRRPVKRAQSAASFGHDPRGDMFRVGNSKFQQYIPYLFEDTRPKLNVSRRPRPETAASITRASETRDSVSSKTLDVQPPVSSGAAKKPDTTIPQRSMSASGSRVKGHRHRQQPPWKAANSGIGRDKSVLMQSSMPPGFGDANPKTRAAFYTSANPASKHFVRQEDVYMESRKPLERYMGQGYHGLRRRQDDDLRSVRKRNSQEPQSAKFLEELQTNNANKQKSRQGLMKTTLVLGTHPASYDTQANADFVPRKIATRSQASSIENHLATTLSLGAHPPSYETAYEQQYKDKGNGTVNPIKDRAGLLASSMVLGTHKTQYETSAQAQFSDKGFDPSESSGSRTKLMRSSLRLGSHTPQYTTAHKDSYFDKMSQLDKSGPLGNRQQLMGSSMVLGKHANQWRTAYQDQYETSAGHLMQQSRRPATASSVTSSSNRSFHSSIDLTGNIDTWH